MNTSWTLSYITGYSETRTYGLHYFLSPNTPSIPPSFKASFPHQLIDALMWATCISVFLARSRFLCPRKESRLVLVEDEALPISSLELINKLFKLFKFRSIGLWEQNSGVVFLDVWDLGRSVSWHLLCHPVGFAACGWADAVHWGLSPYCSNSIRKSHGSHLLRPYQVEHLVKKYFPPQ